MNLHVRIFISETQTSVCRYNNGPPVCKILKILLKLPTEVLSKSTVILTCMYTTKARVTSTKQIADFLLREFKSRSRKFITRNEWHGFIYFVRRATRYDSARERISWREVMRTVKRTKSPVLYVSGIELNSIIL